MEAESYLHPHKHHNLTTQSTLPVAPVLKELKLSATEQSEEVEQLVAATPTKSDPMESIMRRLDEIESQLKS